MKNKPLSFTLFLVICNLMLFGQDFILKMDPVITQKAVVNAAIKNDTIVYSNPGDSISQSCGIQDIYGIQFNESGNDNLLMMSYNTEIIKSEVESINKRYIYFRDTNNLLHSIDINNVYCILFDQPNSEKVSDSIFINYINMRNSSYVRNSKLIRSNNSVLNISNDIGLHNDTINIQLESDKGNVTKTFAAVNTLKTYINKEPADRIFKKSFGNYVLDSSDNFFEVKDLNLERNSINFVHADNRTGDETKIEKNSLIGIFFYNYESPIVEEEIPEIPEIVEVKKVKKEKKDPKPLYVLENKKYTADIAVGYGNMLSQDNTFDFLGVNDEYKSKVQRGATLDMNLRVFATHNFGVGLKYNMFSSNNKYNDVLTEKIKVKFLGATFYGNIPISNQRWLFNIDLSIGFITRSEYFVISDKQYYISGTTPGLYISTGLEYFVYKNISAGLYFGLMGGSLKEPEINTNYDDNFVVDKARPLGRFDSLIRIKAYL